MPFQKIPSLDVSYALISFDGDGRERTNDPEEGVFSRNVFKPGRIYNLESSRFIPDHSGIDGPQIAHALWQAVITARGQRV